MPATEAPHHGPALRSRPVRRALAVPLALVLLLSLRLGWSAAQPATAATLTTVTAAADATVQSDAPDSNDGTDPVLTARALSDTKPEADSYLKFTVSGLTAPPAGVQLQLYSYATTATGVRLWTGGSDWTETGITFANRPARGSTMVAAMTNLAADTWASADVSSVVTGNGTYTFVIDTTSTLGKQFAARETAGRAPQLVVNTSQGPSVTAVSGSGQTTATGTAFAAPLVAEVDDASGGPVPDVPVTFTAPATGASAAFAGGSASITVATDASGRATSPALTANAAAGSYAVTATTTGAAGPASFTLTNGTPPPTSSPSPSPSPSQSTTSGGGIAATGGSGQSAMVGRAFAAPLTVGVSGAGAGVTVTFAAPATGPSGTFPDGTTQATATTGADGTATSPALTAGASAGSFAVTATAAGVPGSARFSLTATDPVIVAAGDIACPAGKAATATSCQQQATSDLALSLHPDAVLPLGDDQYELGAQSDFQSVYGPGWGRMDPIAHPAPGNHEYGYIGSAIEPTGGAGYFSYYGDRSHPLAPGCTSLCTSWYSWDIGGWHLISLDSQCAVIGGCNPGNPEYKWLQADLNAHTNSCVLAYWHIPVYSSSQDHQPDMQAIYSLLYAKGADVVLTGHAHFYERFAGQDGAGNADPVKGIPQFVVGTGGRSFFSIRPTPAANSVSRIANTFGVLQMTLSHNAYSWNFVPANDGGSTDSGSGSCH